MRCYKRLMNISYKDHVTNEGIRNRTQNAIGVHDDLLTMVKKTQMVWPHLKILGHGEDNSAGDKKERKTEDEMGRMDGNGVWRFPESSGRQGRMERYCCKIICGAPTTSEVKGLS